MIKPKVVIVGGGFAGLAAAWELKDSSYHVTLLDKRNFNLFQPLLYQVATASLTEADITFPLRSALTKDKNVSVYRTKVHDFDIINQMVITDEGDFEYDKLVVCNGVTHNYFGNTQWAEHAPGLKTIEDALEIRNRIFMAFEKAELEKDSEKRKALLRFVVVGSGPTGVELAGSLGELAHNTLRKDFRNFVPSDVEIILVEGSDRVLPAYSSKLSQKAVDQLHKLGVTVITNTRVTDIQSEYIRLKSEDSETNLPTQTVLWAAGMKTTPLAGLLADKTGARQDTQGRIEVNPDLTIPGHSNIFVLGDISHLKDKSGKPLPGIAPVAMQEGFYVGKLLKKQAHGESGESFEYFDKGNMAVIGKNAAVAQLGKLEFSGYIAWILWVVVHIWYLIGYDNKLMIMLRWAWTYWTSKRGSRLIVHDNEMEENSSKAFLQRGITRLDS